MGLGVETVESWASGFWRSVSRGLSQFCNIIKSDQGCFFQTRKFVGAQLYKNAVVFAVLCLGFWGWAEPGRNDREDASLQAPPRP